MIGALTGASKGSAGISHGASTAQSMQGGGFMPSLPALPLPGLSIMSNVMRGASDKISGKILKNIFGDDRLREAGKSGEALRHFLKTAYPGTSPWEHVKSGGAGGFTSPSINARQAQREDRKSTRLNSSH